MVRDSLSAENTELSKGCMNRPWPTTTVRNELPNFCEELRFSRSHQSYPQFGVPLPVECYHPVGKKNPVVGMIVLCSFSTRFRGDVPSVVNKTTRIVKKNFVQIIHPPKFTSGAVNPSLTRTHIPRPPLSFFSHHPAIFLVPCIDQNVKVHLHFVTSSFNYMERRMSGNENIWRRSCQWWYLQEKTVKNSIKNENSKQSSSNNHSTMDTHHDGCQRLEQWTEKGSIQLRFCSSEFHQCSF